MTRGDLEKLLEQPVNFLADDTPDGDIAISSRIRLARNLAGRPFPGAATPENRCEVRELVTAAACAGTEALGCPDCWTFDPEEMSQLDREVLAERRLASSDLLAAPQGTRLLVRADEVCSIMVNEEDQLRIQALRPGVQLETLWREINALDDELSERLDYAFDSRWGYLTSCPTNLGTGMRASVMLHLPGLVMSGLIGPTIQGIGKLNLAVRGLFGEGSDNRGNLFQISNQSTLGESEAQIIGHLLLVIRQLIAYEEGARRQLLANDRNAVFDQIGRAYGVLRHSYRLPFDEALTSLSGLRFGVDLGMFRKVDLHKVNRLFLAVGPAYLQKSAGLELAREELDVRRAAVCREILA